jgi:DNA-binding NarL/FixJ family response regulator
MQNVKIYIADDHRLVRAGFIELLKLREDFEVVGEAGNGREMLDAIKEARPDVILLDISMPELNGIDAIYQIKKLLPAARIIMLSMHDKEKYIKDSLQEGALGYLLKDVTADELFRAVDTVMKGEYYFSKEIEQRVIVDYRRGLAGPEKDSKERLTRREREIWQLIAEGNTGKDVADKLNISPRTVENHRSKIMSKLGCHSIAELTRLAIKEGLVDP